MQAMIVVAESRGLVRAGLVGLLSEWSGAPVPAAATLEAALALMPAGGWVLLLDLDLLGVAGPAGLTVVRRRVPQARIIVLAGRESRDGILACLAAGAHGYVARTAEFEELVRAIGTVRDGGVHVPAALAAASAAAPAPAPAPVLVPGTPRSTGPALTGRQQDVLRLLAEGRSTKDIARTLDLAVSTIKVHLAALYRTVGARNRVEALRRSGLMPALGHAA